MVVERAVLQAADGPGPADGRLNEEVFWFAKQVRVWRSVPLSGCGCWRAGVTTWHATNAAWHDAAWDSACSWCQLEQQAGAHSHIHTPRCPTFQQMS